MTATTSKVHRYSDKSPGAWQAFLDAMHSGEPFECDEEHYRYWLGVLPPVWMGRPVHWPDFSVVADFGFAEGAEHVTAFWHKQVDGARRYFGRRTNEMNRG